MSANNWTTCPNCKKEAEEKYQEEEKALDSAYGVVSASRFSQLAEEHSNNSVEKILGKYTLREDYDIGVGADGIFEVSYRAFCDKCGLKFSYKHKERI